MALVTRGDIIALVLRALDEKEGMHLLRRLLSDKTERVKLTWQQQRTSVRNWDEIPQVSDRMNRLVTGERDVSTFRYVADRYLSKGEFTAVSFGCGTGSREISWAGTGRFKRIVGVDISEARIKEAGNKLAESQFAAQVEFVAADLFLYPIERGSLDVVIAEGALHHLAPLEAIFDKIRSALKPGGLLVVNDYVGPDRFQWTSDQMLFCDSLLSFIPERMRTYRGTSLVKRKVRRPGTLSMKIHDPSEAVEPSKTMKLIHNGFEILSKADYGGTILHPLLKDIAHHFADGGAEADTILQFLFMVEDYLLRNGMISSDFTFIVAKKT